VPSNEGPWEEGKVWRAARTEGLISTAKSSLLPAMVSPPPADCTDALETSLKKEKRRTTEQKTTEMILKIRFG